MVLVFGLIVIVLVVINVLQYLSRRKLNQDLQGIIEKVADILEQASAEKVFIQTDQKNIQLLLIQINRLLDNNQKVIADYSKTKESLRKMLSNMSHDLKTPLTVILGYVEKLKLDQEMTEKERNEITFRLHQKTLSVIALMNKFFDLVKIESDDYAIPLSRISINEICRKNVLEFFELLQETGLQVEIDIPEQPYYILGNEEALNRILSNLISNSIRYGSDGGVFGLTLREDGKYMAIDIWDKGKGISEVHQDRVFERLYTLDDARNPQFLGSGLGLSITKRLTESMKGSIHLSSKPYKKTVFTCVFKRITY
ncbi:sensor histidine kinase KdpD [Paenibacillus sp. J2TS4]|uniref:sensor histidine kinase n=1 Tax=Paenibacillus sp. J2TS4 TaxID=2807194 RepID=UPI001B152AB5|nr:sensor histidine kinase [Paenibacillus sp. J2TS4]GIP31710.1 two-component sensor histidine kinase [Paenibacillus sp. J2TS4]